MPGMTMAARAWRVGISIGTAHTVAMLRAPETRPRPILLSGGTPLMPSSADAIYPGHRDPLRPGSPLPGHLARTAQAVRRAAGGEPVETTVSCPPEWENSRRSALAEAVSRAGLGRVEVVSESIAAAAYLTGLDENTVGVGGLVLVFDAGASSIDVGLVRRTGDGFELVSFECVEDAGGIRLDRDLVEFIGGRTAGQDRAASQRLQDPLTPVDRAARLLLWAEVRGLRERLSFEPATTLTVPLTDAEVTVTRDEFEGLAATVLARALRATQDVLGTATVDAVFLVGGAARAPMFARLLAGATGHEPRIARDPELVIAEGCALLPRREAPMLDEDVQFTVYRPVRLPPTRWESMLVFAHKSDPVVDPVSGPIEPPAEVRARAERFFGGEPPAPRTVDARQPLARGTEIRVVPDLPGVECNPREVVLDWQEPVHEDVRAEWECALGLERPSFVRPLYWEDPLPEAPHRGLPPEELRRLHFARVPVAAVAAGPGVAGTPATAVPGAPAWGQPPPVVPRAPAPASVPAPVAYLEVTFTDRGSTRFALPRQHPVVIGTAPNADLRLTDSFASRRHAEISTSRGGRFVVDDLGSTNGTTVNGRRLHDQEALHPGDVIMVGRTRLEFQPPPAVPPQSSAPGQASPPAERRNGGGGGGGGGGLIVAGAGLAVAGLGWWLLAAYAAMVVGLSALAVGLVLLVAGLVRSRRRPDG